MMKIGVLTFHKGNNYGGILQCYALQQTLALLGHNVEIINYYGTDRPSLLRRLSAKIATAENITDLFASLKDVFRVARSVSFDKKINDASLRVFDDFRSKYLRISPALTPETIGEYANEHYDLIIVGSDQVWTSLYERPLAYMLDWKPNYVGKRMSYAACSAFKRIAGKQKKIVKECLDKFDLITVRDRTTQQLVENVLGKNPLVVPDPSLLYSYDEFISEEEREPYILTYILGDEIKGGHKKAIDKIKQSIGDLPVYSIVIPCNSQDVTLYADKVLSTISPCEWVNLFYHASYVYTDSFHAIMFSLKFRKRFSAYYRNKVRSSRLLDLKKLGISCIYGDADELQISNEIFCEELLKRKFTIGNLLKDLEV